MRYFLSIVLLFLLVSCDPNVLFREPQPVDSKDLVKFPARYHGTYLETMDDSSVYVLTSDYILQKYVEDLELPVAEILEDEEVALKGDSVILPDLDLAFPVVRRNDSIFGRVTVYDTIFDLTADDKLRKFQKHYFLNFPRDTLWMVLKLQFGRDQRVYLFDINEEKEAEIFKENSQVEVIPNKEGKPDKYIMNPSRKELKTLLKLQTFTDTTEFIRISK